MKTAIYIEDGTVQLVLTPESEFEKNALRSFEGKETRTLVFCGSFYDCRGGWVRQSRYYEGPYGQAEDRSLILRIGPKPDEQELPQGGSS